MLHDRWPGAVALGEFDRLFDRFMGGRGATTPATHPLLNVRDGDDEVVVEAEVPGVDPAALTLSLDGDKLVLVGSRGTENENRGRSERWRGSFRREITLATPIDESRAEARFEDGVLTIRLPKSTAAAPRRIEILTPGSED